MGCSTDSSDTYSSDTYEYTLGFSAGFSATSAEELREADKALVAERDRKKEEYERYAKKSNDGMSLLHSLRKYERLKIAYIDANSGVANFHKGLTDGALKAFREGRPENLQEVLTSPYIALAPALVSLLEEKPECSALNLALTKLPTEKKQEGLTHALSIVLRDSTPNMEGKVAALLQAGAQPSVKMLADALYEGRPTAVVDILAKEGPTIDDALTYIRDNSYDYQKGTMAIEFSLYKREADARIKELEETVRELTEGKPAPAKPEDKPAPEPKAEEPAPVTRISGFRKPAP